MKLCKRKKQPTRHDFALALKTIRAQFQTIESQSDTILRQNQFIATLWMEERTRAACRKSRDKVWPASPNGWVNLIGTASLEGKGGNRCEFSTGCSENVTKIIFLSRKPGGGVRRGSVRCGALHLRLSPIHCVRAPHRSCFRLCSSALIHSELAGWQYNSA